MKKGLIDYFGFTDGEWKGLHGGGIDKRGNHHIVSDSKTVAILRKSKNDTADSRIISKCKPLLNSYISLVIDSINNEYTELAARFSRSKTEHEILKIAEGRLSEEIKMIEDCSGVSWDEIKKIMEEMKLDN